MSKAGRWLAGLILVLAGSGCPGGASVGTVVGEVTLEGQPLKKGSVRFVPLDGKTPTAGAIIADGHFTAQVPVGTMRVEINAVKVVGQRRAYDAPDSPLEDEVVEIIPAKYNRQSELTLTVQRGTQKVRYELTGR